MSVKFGTSGLRGLAVDLVGRTARQYAWAFGQVLLQRGLVQKGSKVCIGWDYRASSPDIVADVCSSLAALGLTPVSCGAVPTPALALYAMTRGCASIMVTGSHIPADRNGIKFYLPTGEISKHDEKDIATCAAEWRETNAASVEVFSNVQEDAEYEFKQRYLAFFGADALKGLRLGVYQHSTVGRDLLVDVLNGLGAETVPLARSEHFVPVDTEAVSPETENVLKRWSATGTLDAILSADGDADRPLVADETGAVIRGDALGLLTAQHLGAKVIVTPATSNSGIEGAFDGKVLRTRVGSPFVVEAMQAVADQGVISVAGFEANGGFMCQSSFADGARVLAPLPTRDSFLPMLATLRACVIDGKSLSALNAALKLNCVASGRLENFPQARSSAIMEALAREGVVAAFLSEVGTVRTINTLDGMRVTLDHDRIVHFRASGNAPEFRCYVEAADQTEADELLQWCLEAVEKH